MKEIHVIDDYGINTTIYRHLMQQKLNRRLSPQELVHHINLDHSDNRIENLMIMSASEHSSFHSKLPRGKRIDASDSEKPIIIPLLTPKEVCEMLRISLQDLLTYVKLGKIKSLRLSRNTVRYEKSEIKRFAKGE